ncbi:MAG: T9SS type A sorting domain-containing protein [Bacteroidetes bacterium]|nr:T9SS type A sorting domain-containing protein [Bacteroidota bacterium]
MKNLFLVFIFLFSVGLSAQTPFANALSISFANSSKMKDVSRCSDGGYVLCMDMNTFPQQGAYVVRTDVNGQMQWARSVTPPSNADQMNTFQVAESVNGGYYLFGEYMDSASNIVNYFITFLDVNGNLLSTKRIPTDDYTSYDPHIQQDSAGGFCIATCLYYKMAMIRTDASGNVLWAHAVSNNSTFLWPVNSSYDCLINDDGSLLLSGTASSHLVLQKTNAAGQTIWIHGYSDGQSGFLPFITAHATGGYLIAGDAGNDRFIMKTDTSGNISWYDAFPSVATSASDFSFTDMYELSSGEIEISGASFYTSFLDFTMRLDAAGNVLSANTIGDGNSLEFYNSAMCITPLDEIVLSGYAVDQANSLSGESILRTNTGGNFSCLSNPYTIFPDTAAPIPTIQPDTFYFLNENWSAVTSLNFHSTNLPFTQADFCTLFSVNENNQAEDVLKIYPSPVEQGENIFIETDHFSGEYFLTFYDVIGKTVKKFNRTFSGVQEKTELETSGLAKGIYMLRITNEKNELVGAGKFAID